MPEFTGVSHIEPTVRGDGWVVVIRDPDNIQLELFAVSPTLGRDLA